MFKVSILSFIVNAQLSFAGSFISLEVAKKWLISNNKCQFSAVRYYLGNSDKDKNILSILGAKPGDLMNYSNPNRTPILCVYDGSYGKGAIKETGCILSYFLIDKDEYEDLRNEAYHNSWVPIKIMIPGKCDKPKVQKLLFDYKLGSLETSSFGGNIVNDDIFVNFGHGGYTLDIKAEIINDAFGIKGFAEKREKEIIAKEEKQEKEENIKMALSKKQEEQRQELERQEEIKKTKKEKKLKSLYE